LVIITSGRNSFSNSFETEAKLSVRLLVVDSAREQEHVCVIIIAAESYKAPSIRLAVKCALPTLEIPVYLVVGGISSFFKF